MKLSFLLIAVLAVLSNCSSSDNFDQGQNKTVAVAGETADFLQMTQDHRQNTIAWWVEKNEDTGEGYVYFAKSDSSGLSFRKSHRIETTRDISAGSEHMPKLVIKPDGTYVLVFARLNKKSNTAFAGSVLYTQSFDEGTNWSEPKRIHSDTHPGNSHGFPEAILLPDGEVGAVWLDGRHHLEHSEIYFAKTNGKEGFGEDKLIGGPSCQCCKLDMFVNKKGMLHLVYRGLTGNNIRDIQHISSDDNGRAFSPPTIVSNDNWQIMACPHNGPSVTQLNKKLYVVWYTQGGKEGLYFSSSEDNGQTFSHRQFLTEQAKHPYTSFLGHSVLAIWDEIAQNSQGVYNRVRMSTISNGEVVNTKYISPLNVDASVPYLITMENKDVVVTWTEHLDDRNELHFQRFSAK